MNVPDSKSGVLARVPWVRIPPSPPPSLPTQRFFGKSARRPGKSRDSVGFWARGFAHPHRRLRVPRLKEAAAHVFLCCQVGRFGFALDSPQRRAGLSRAILRVRILLAPPCSPGLRRRRARSARRRRNYLSVIRIRPARCLAFRVAGAQLLRRLPPDVIVVKTTQSGRSATWASGDGRFSASRPAGESLSWRVDGQERGGG